MWRILPALDENNVPLQKRRRDFFKKNHPDALYALEERLSRLRSFLDTGMPLRMALSSSWVHPEKAGVFAVCINKPALRLYFLPLPEKKILLTLNIGDKNRQSADVVEAGRWAASILAGREQG